MAGRKRKTQSKLPGKQGGTTASAARTRTSRAVPQKGKDGTCPEMDLAGSASLGGQRGASGTGDFDGRTEQRGGGGFGGARRTADGQDAFGGVRTGGVGGSLPQVRGGSTFGAVRAAQGEAPVSFGEQRGSGHFTTGRGFGGARQISDGQDAFGGTWTGGVGGSLPQARSSSTFGAARAAQGKALVGFGGQRRSDHFSTERGVGAGAPRSDAGPFGGEPQLDSGPLGPLMRLGAAGMAAVKDLAHDFGDKDENYWEKFGRGDIGGGLANAVGTMLQAPQSLYLNTLTAAQDLAAGKQPEFQYRMDALDYMKKSEERSDTQGKGHYSKLIELLNSERLSRRLLGNALAFGANLGSDPMSYLDAVGVIKGRWARTPETPAYGEAVSSGREAARLAEEARLIDEGWRDNEQPGMENREEVEQKGPEAAQSSGTTGGDRDIITKSSTGAEEFHIEDYRDGVMIPDEQFGKKIGKHAVEFGMDPRSYEDRQQLYDMIQEIVSKPDEVKIGEWRGQGGIIPGGNHESGQVLFFIKNFDVVIVKDGTFISIIKNGANYPKILDMERIF